MAKKKCNCSPEKRVNGTHYSWCESFEDMPKLEVKVENKKQCDCDAENRNGNHAFWCESLEKGE